MMKKLFIARAPVSESDEFAVFYRITAGREWSFLFPHTPEEDLKFFKTNVFPNSTVWSARLGDELVGFCAVRRGWIDHLFVRHDHHGQGIGQALLGRSLRGRQHVQLWTFQRNCRSRRFYAESGFVEVRLTDGRDNEEREPDVLLAWRRPTA